MTPKKIAAHIICTVRARRGGWHIELELLARWEGKVCGRAAARAFPDIRQLLVHDEHCGSRELSSSGAGSMGSQLWMVRWEKNPRVSHSPRRAPAHTRRSPPPRAARIAASAHCVHLSQAVSNIFFKLLADAIQISYIDILSNAGVAHLRVEGSGRPLKMTKDAGTPVPFN